MRTRRWVMLAMAMLLVPTLMFGWAGAAYGQTDSTPAAEGTPAEEATTVFVRVDPALGPFLTDANGMTLYLFTNDTEEGVSACYDDCAAAWPPFTADEPLSLPGNVEGELTTITRDDGTTQIAYNGIPLYYWQNDTAPGQTTGQGVGDVWYIVPPGMQFGDPANVPMATPDAAMGTPAAAGEVTVTLTEFTVESSVTTFKVGEEYTFNVTNMGEFPHEFYIETAGAHGEPLEANGEEAEIEPMDAGGSGTLTWTFSEPGTYQLACHVRSHYPMGMALTIQVVE
jgi:predicted lipoprotein with Yx(FWY)xxD motif/uncharacterized cupredoxin-like copper-binding protein